MQQQYLDEKNMFIPKQCVKILCVTRALKDNEMFKGFFAASFHFF